MSLPAADRRIPDLVSTVEAAGMLGVTRQAIQLMATAGTLPGRKVGSTWVFRREAVLKVQAERATDNAQTAEADSPE